MQKLPCMVKLKPWVLSHLFAKAQNSPKPKGPQSYCCSKLSLFVESSQQLEAMLANQKKATIKVTTASHLKMVHALPFQPLASFATWFVGLPCHGGCYQKMRSMLEPTWPARLESRRFPRKKRVWLPIMPWHLEVQGDIVSRLITPIIHIATPLIPIIFIRTKSP